MSDYQSPYTPVMSWQLAQSVAFTLTVDGTAEAINKSLVDVWGYATSGGTFPAATAATDSVAHAMRVAIATHVNVSSTTAAYAWTSGGNGAGPVARIDIVTTSPISVAPTLAATGSNAAVLGIISSPVTATALAATPTTNWRFEFGPVDGFWWPGNTECWADSRIIRAAYTAVGFANGTGEAVNWGSREDSALVIPTVRGAYVSLARRRSPGYAAQALINPAQPNNLLDNLLDAASNSQRIRVYRTVTDYFTGKILNESTLQDVRNARESQSNQDAVAQYVVAFSGIQ